MRRHNEVDLETEFTKKRSQEQPSRPIGRHGIFPVRYWLLSPARFWFRNISQRQRLADFFQNYCTHVGLITRRAWRVANKARIFCDCKACLTLQYATPRGSRR